MVDSIHLKVVTPEGTVFDEMAHAITACSDVGEFCVLPEHRPILASLKIGKLVVEQKTGKVVFAVDGGFFEGSATAVKIITERCQQSDSIDKQSAAARVASLREDLDKIDEEDVLKRDSVQQELFWNELLVQTASDQ